MTSKLKQIQALYAELPALDCKGKCFTYCGPIEMTKVEAKKIQRRIGHKIGRVGADLVCPLLTRHSGRCSVYPDRPGICRLWGIAQGMPCEYGCLPEGGHWSDAKAYDWLNRLFEIDGNGNRQAGIDRIVNTHPK